jgi:hypothetical protein
MKVKEFLPKVDSYGCVQNCYESAMYVRGQLLKKHSVAIPLPFGAMTMFHVSFVPLWVAIPDSLFIVYSDGSNRGVQINIDRIASYSLPLGSTVQEAGYVSEKWNMPYEDAHAFLPFLNTVMSGENYFLKQK